ncbi:hypothetical protein EL22_28805 [Halostagnicola sp. A56]|nr:hypothetical protein EL22_28805 [Halostagnicola sp. A56]
MYDSDKVTIFYIDSEVWANYSEEEFEEALRTLIFDHSIDEIGIQSDDCWSAVLHFSEFSVLRVRVTEESRVSISFERGQSVSVPDFAESIESIFDT